MTIACALVFAGAGSGAHAQDEPQDCSVAIGDYEGSAVISVDPVTVTPGGSVTITGVGFPPNVLVPLFFNDEPIGSPVTDENGAFTFVYTIPADTPAGTFEFSAACGTFILTSNITVTPIPPVPGPTTPITQAPTQPLPTTGADSLPLVQIAGALIVVGGLVLFLTRRQHERRREGTVA